MQVQYILNMSCDSIHCKNYHFFFFLLKVKRSILEVSARFFFMTREKAH